MEGGVEKDVIRSEVGFCLRPSALEGRMFAPPRKFETPRWKGRFDQDCVQMEEARKKQAHKSWFMYVESRGGSSRTW